MINLTRLENILDYFNEVNILVIGDFFLDNYMIIDRKLSRKSLETDLEAYQVTSLLKTPGAAGSVAANLRSLDVNVIALGVTGEDGNGYDLRRCLKNIHVDVQALIKFPGMYTSAYNKPIIREINGMEHEINRLDIENRIPLSIEIEHEIIEQLYRIVPSVQAVLIVDQIQCTNCGTITDKVREEIEKLARANPSKFFIVDSRERAGLFKDVILKMNLQEAMKASGIVGKPALENQKNIYECCLNIYNQNQRPIIITRGENDTIVFKDPNEPIIEVQTVSVKGPVDEVGAGDSFLASMGTSLCVGASLEEATLIGNIAASIVVQKIGTTGTVSRKEIIERCKRIHWKKDGTIDI